MSPRDGIWAQGDSCVTQQWPPRFTCHPCHVCPADSEPRCSFYRRGRIFLLRVTSSQSAFDNFKLSVDEITFVLPFKKTPGERSVPDKSDFSSLLYVFLGCSSGLCFTPRSNSGQPFPALHPLEPPRCPGDGQAGLGLCLVQVEAANRAQSFV